MTSNRWRIDLDEKKIDAIFQDLDQCQLPGAAVGIAVGSRPVYRKGYGLANMELPLNLSPTVRLRIGSESKQFTCLAYMLLCEEGKCQIDDTLGKHLPEVHPTARGVTIRQLMGHTSGLRDVYSVFGYFNEPYSRHCGPAQSVDSAALLKVYGDLDEHEAAPGTRWSYNNGAYLLLSAVIERVADDALESVFRTRIFDPIGMKDSLLLRGDTAYIPNRAAQHVGSATAGFQKLTWGLDNFLGAGAVVSTIDDMLRWLAHMDNPSVGCADTWEAMFTPQRLTNGTSTGYGLGILTSSYRGCEVRLHGGNAFGGNALMLKAPSAGLDIAVVSNRQDAFSGLLVNQILDRCLPDLEPLKQHRGAGALQGLFRSPTSGRVIELRAEVFAPLGPSPRQMVYFDGFSVPSYPDETGVLWLAENHPRQSIRYIAGHQGSERIVFDDYGNHDELIKLEAAGELAPGNIVGAWDCPKLRVRANILERRGELLLTVTGPYASINYRLKQLASRIWHACCEGANVRYLVGVLTFEEDEETFLFSGYMMRSIQFLRR